MHTELSRMDAPSLRERPTDARRDADTAGAPIYPRAEDPGARRAAALSREASDYRSIVERELTIGTDAEAYWNRLSAQYDARSARRREGAGDAREDDAVRRIRLEMNALIPHLASARVRADVKRFADVGAYRDWLSGQIARADTMSSRAGGDERAMRVEIDRGHLFRQQFAETAGITPERWQRLRARAFREEARSVLDELPDDALEPLTLDGEIDMLRQRLAGLRFWQLVEKSRVVDRIAALELRAAILSKRSGA